MESSRPLTYPCQKSVLSYLSFDKRKQLAKNCEPLRNLNQIQNYHFDKVQIEHVDEPDTEPTWLVSLDEDTHEFYSDKGTEEDILALSKLVRRFLKFYLDRKGTTVHFLHVQIRFEDWINMIPTDMNLSVFFGKIRFLGFDYHPGALKSLETMNFEELRLFSEGDDDQAFEEVQKLNLDVKTLCISTMDIEQRLLMGFAKNIERFRCIEYDGTLEKVLRICEIFKEKPVIEQMYSVGIPELQLKEQLDAKCLEWKGEKIVVMKTCDPKLELVICKVTPDSTSVMVKEAGFGQSCCELTPRDHLLLLPFISVFAVGAAQQICFFLR